MIFPAGKRLLSLFSKQPPHIKDWWETYYEQKDECTTSLFSVAPTWNSFQDAIKGNEKGKKIIDAEPNTTVSTAKVQKNEPEDPEEGEHLFHSQMWVKGSPLQFIVDNGSQKKLISIKVVKRLGLPTIPHL